MSYRICETLETEKQAMRDVYCQTMIDLANQNDRIVVMDADLMNSVGTVPFGEAHPERTVNCGIQEANMIGVAAGMSAVGMVPYCHTFGCFATRRCLDQIFVSAAFAKANIRIIGSDPGITAAMNGATHMPFEDMGSLRDIPGVTIIEPTDSIMLDNVIRQLERANGVYYVRLSRKNAVQIYQPGSTFEIGKAAELRPGTDVTLMATGVCVAEALKAAISWPGRESARLWSMCSPSSRLTGMRWSTTPALPAPLSRPKTTAFTTVWAARWPKLWRRPALCRWSG